MIPCKECAFWHQYRGGKGKGECRKNPPVGVVGPFAEERFAYRGMWPLTLADEGCGEGEVPVDPWKEDGAGA